VRALCSISSELFYGCFYGCDVLFWGWLVRHEGGGGIELGWFLVYLVSFSPHNFTFSTPTSTLSESALLPVEVWCLDLCLYYALERGLYVRFEAVVALGGRHGLSGRSMAGGRGV